MLDPTVTGLPDPRDKRTKPAPAVRAAYAETLRDYLLKAVRRIGYKVRDGITLEKVYRLFRRDHLAHRTWPIIACRSRAHGTVFVLLDSTGFAQFLTATRFNGLRQEEVIALEPLHELNEDEQHTFDQAKAGAQKLQRVHSVG